MLRGREKTQRLTVQDMILSLALSLSGSLIIGIKFLPELWKLHYRHKDPGKLVAVILQL
jgi:hypothetical protein